MLIDISELIANKTIKKEIHLELEKDKLWDGNEFIEFSKPIKFDGTLKFVGEIFELEGTIEAELILICSRCLEKFPYTLGVEVHEKLSNNHSHNDDEIILIMNDKIDVSEIIENNIIVMLPMKRLCKEDCSGLCQQCGTNLNRKTCKCYEDEVDPRLAKLKDLFSSN